MRAAGRLAEAGSVVGNTVRAFGLLWRISPPRCVALASVVILDALLPAGVAWVAKLIVDAVVGGDPNAAILWVACECSLVLLKSVLYHVNELLTAHLGGRLGIRVNELVLDKALDMSLSSFEDPEFNDRLTRANREAGQRPLHVVKHGFGVIREAIRLASLSVILAGFSGWLVLGILAGTTPQFLAQAWAASESFRVVMRRTLEERRADYLREVLSREAFVKEVKLFAMGRYLLQGYLRKQERFFCEDIEVTRRTLLLMFLARLLATLAFYVCYVAVAMKAVSDAITLGDMTMLLLAVRGSQESFEAVLNNAAKIYEGNLYMTNLFTFLSTPPDEPFEALDAGDEGRAEGRDPPEIAFEGVGFAYAGAGGRVLDGVSFRIRPGETLALVGRNGAGKTTLVKLLARLYEPDAGRITLDGTPISEIEPARVRRRLGVIFQDFVQYHLTARENVGMGWIPSIDDYAEVRAASIGGGAHDLIEGLPEGYSTVFGRYYGGVQLSVGQWQQVALSRAFMRHSDVLILDEPSAALDAEAEASLHGRLEELKGGRTAILITHRFSTVRFADRIVVLDGGRVAEEGTHAELVGKGGLYASMFDMQARGYRIDGGGSR